MCQSIYDRSPDNLSRLEDSLLLRLKEIKGLNPGLFLKKLRQHMASGGLSVNSKRMLMTAAAPESGALGWFRAADMAEESGVNRTSLYGELDLLVAGGALVATGLYASRRYILSPEWGGPVPTPEPPLTGADATRAEVLRAIIALQEGGFHPVSQEIARAVGRVQATANTHIAKLIEDGNVVAVTEHTPYYVAVRDMAGKELASPDFTQSEPVWRKDTPPPPVGIPAMVLSTMIRYTLIGRDCGKRDLQYLRSLPGWTVDRSLKELLKSGHIEKADTPGKYRAVLMMDGTPVAECAMETYEENGVTITKCPPPEKVGYMPIKEGARAGVLDAG